MANDNSGEAVTLTSDYSPGDNFTIGNTIVTYTAVDVYGNVATYSFDVVVTGKLLLTLQKLLDMAIFYNVFILESSEYEMPSK